MTKTIPISEVKAHLPDLVTGVEEREEEVIVTRKGRPAAVLVNFLDYERMRETLEILSDPDLMRQIERSRKYFARGGKGLSLEKAFAEPIAVRRKRARK